MPTCRVARGRLAKAYVRRPLALLATSALVAACGASSGSEGSTPGPHGESTGRAVGTAQVAAPDAETGGTRDAQADGTSIAAGAPEAASESWSSFGRDLSHTRFNAAEQRISKDSVQRLRLAWKQSARGVTATPAIVDGIVYWTDWDSGAHANRVSDGQVVWERKFSRGFTSSPCVDENHVYLSDRHATVYALERATGSTVWSVEIDTVALTHLWSSPVISRGVVIVGIAADGTQADGMARPQEEIATFRGAVVGLDEASGETLWRFELTRDAAGEYAPGVSVWASAAVDETAGILFVGSGNAYALPAGPYSDALIALDVRTGALVWHRQFTPDDAFSSGNFLGGPDFDVGASANLFTIQRSGAPLDVVGVGDKSGTYRVLERDTGAMVWERAIDPDLLLGLRKTGGIIASAAHANGRIFVATNTSWNTSKLSALDAATGTVEWESVEWGSVNFGAPAVANGVVFAGASGYRVDELTLDGLGMRHPSELVALHADTGSVLAQIPLHAGRGGGFAVAEGRVFIGTGFTFYAYSEEPLDGAIEVFEVP